MRGWGRNAHDEPAFGRSCVKRRCFGVAVRVHRRNPVAPSPFYLIEILKNRLGTVLIMGSETVCGSAEVG